MTRPRPFAERLLGWWDQHGRTDLPWQGDRAAYRVWVSEIMLQQTQVGTVIPYFVAWMGRFPDLSSLAAAPLDDVLAHWAGLGYYARARNLHRAARICVERHGGDLPVNVMELTALPGIGLSTANAIISQATNQPAAVLDGNVRRVLARHAMIDGWPGASAVQKNLWQQAERYLPERRGADYTQAIMDLGAMVCTRARPACKRCPVAGDCKAYSADAVARYPSTRPRIRVGERSLTLLIITDQQQRVLLERRPPAGIWGGLWCLPESADPEQAGAVLGFTPSTVTPLAAVQHRLTHLRLRINPILVHSVRAEQVKCASQHTWLALLERSRLGLPKPVADLLQQLANGDFE